MQRTKTGITGLDTILHGGLMPLSGTLVRGGPGSGKTTLGMHFLSEGAKNKEKVLFITLGENEKNLRSNAERLGIDTSSFHFLDLSPSSDFFSDTKAYDLFSAAELDKSPITQNIIESVQKVRPKRVFFDSTSHLRYLSIDVHQFRKQLLSFIRFLLEQNATVLFTSESTYSSPDDDVMYLSDAIINVTLTDTDRHIEVTKLRGSAFISGKHTLKLTDRGYEVFPRLIPSEHKRNFNPILLSSGVAGIDALLHGGLERGTVSVISGPAGVGKTSLGLSFLKESAKNEQRSVMFSFEESLDALLHRCKGIGIPLNEMIMKGKLVVKNIEPLLYSSDEITHLVREEVEKNNATAVMIDSVAGYNLAIRNRDNPVAELRSLFKYLTNMGVSVLAVNETEAVVGDFRATEMGISYMCDNIIFIRYLEIQGEMRKAIGILKKRMSDFERNLREFFITHEGLKVGLPLKNLRGILKGVPHWAEGEVPPKK